MARRGQRTQNNKFAMSMQYLKKEFSYEVRMFVNMKVFYKLIVLFFMVLASMPKFQITRVSLQYLFDFLRKKSWTKLGTYGSNTTLTIYYTSNVLQPFKFCSLNIESITSLFFIWLIVCVL